MGWQQKTTWCQQISNSNHINRRSILLCSIEIGDSLYLSVKLGLISSSSPRLITHLSPLPPLRPLKNTVVTVADQQQHREVAATAHSSLGFQRKRRNSPEFSTATLWASHTYLEPGLLDVGTLGTRFLDIWTPFAQCPWGMKVFGWLFMAENEKSWEIWGNFEPEVIDFSWETDYLRRYEGNLLLQRYTVVI